MFIEDRKFLNNDAGPLWHGFFTRHGGHSAGIYSSLNAGPGSSDDPDHVAQNREVIAQQSGVEAENLLTLHQIHSDCCIVVDSPFAPHDRPQADAMVTDKAGLALGILTADCAPVLFHGQKEDGAPVIGAAHAGWGGALKGVLESAVEQMVRLGAREDSICASIGPCIAPRSYEVGNDFLSPFLQQNEDNARFFSAGKDDAHKMFDLPAYVTARLHAAGVSNVSGAGLDTYADENRFFSYRRTTHRGEPDYGRQISVIVIR